MDIYSNIPTISEYSKKLKVTSVFKLIKTSNNDTLIEPKNNILNLIIINMRLNYKNVISITFCLTN